MNRVCRDWNEEKHEVSESEMTFRPSVYGILIRDEKILLSPQRDGYDFPGGGIEVGETIEQALAREFREETGLTVRMGELVYCGQDFYYSLSHNRAFNTILLYYVCSYVSGNISTDGFDKYERGYAEEAKWIPLASIESIKFHNPIDSLSVIRQATLSI